MQNPNPFPMGLWSPVSPQPQIPQPKPPDPAMLPRRAIPMAIEDSTNRASEEQPAEAATDPSPAGYHYEPRTETPPLSATADPT